MNDQFINFPTLHGAPKSVQEEAVWVRRAIYELQQGKTLGTGNVSRETSAGGTQVNQPQPLNITQLIGQTAAPQKPYVQQFSSLPIATDPASQDGNLISVNGILYRFDGSTTPGTWKPQAAVGTLLQDTYANWTTANYPPTGYPIGTVFLVTTWNVLYVIKVVTGVNTWVYLEGEYVAVVGSLPTTGFNGAALGANDTDLRFGETTYSHRLRFSGTVWNWAPGESGSGMLELFEVDPTGNGWHLYDGTANVPYLKADGTTATITLPDLTSAGALAAFLEGGSPNSGPTAASAPTFTGASFTPSGSVSAPTFTGTPAPITTSTFTPVALATTAMTSLDGSTTSYTPAGTNSTPTFTGTPGTPAGTISATGEPRKLVRRPFFRQ